ncbi:D-alanine--D-alanine ligase B [BD1-7 clade bacterium]|uniref:D-alanine--D-alanine ligase n=1 Tax=BD1-7 clade bacterium TaxID=2029982 RepID=A0A5S9Q9F5_9GAMM|nr:D-alanine--D-alanine ligase B [BD1-7 clade bacterium]CAA0115246.1 D-alanine--D-alanine ligase B [BD1-7 clade bacterium]
MTNSNLLPDNARLAVLFGGEGSERDVSLNSGAQVIAGFKTLGIEPVAIDVPTHQLADAIKSERITHAFIALHGGDGENGTVQALLRSLGVCFTGSDTLGCAIAMDKQRSKLIWQGAGIPTANFVVVDRRSDWSDVKALLGEKVMIKPSREGSSVGMAVVTNADDFRTAVDQAARFDDEILAERWISGNEYTVAILGDQTLPMIRLKTNHVFYDYDAKYLSDDTEYLCPCGLDAEQEQEIRAVALKAYRLLGCSGWGRVDVMTEDDGSYFLLEANTSPGMTDHSLVPIAAAADGMDFKQLVGRILELSVTP